MFKRIRNWYEQRLVRQSAEKTFNALKLSTALAIRTFQILPANSENALIFTGDAGEDIFSISSAGEAKWLKEDSYNEAAEMFLSAMTMQIEDSAGIMQNRIDWENRIATALVSEAKDAPLSAAELTDVLRKCIMYDKLKGVKD